MMRRITIRKRHHLRTEVIGKLSPQRSVDCQVETNDTIAMRREGGIERIVEDGIEDLLVEISPGKVVRTRDVIRITGLPMIGILTFASKGIRQIDKVGTTITHRDGHDTIALDVIGEGLGIDRITGGGDGREVLIDIQFTIATVDRGVVHGMVVDREVEHDGTVASTVRMEDIRIISRGGQVLPCRNGRVLVIVRELVVAYRGVDIHKYLVAYVDDIGRNTITTV